MGSAAVYSGDLHVPTGLILGLRTANERRYFITTSLIGLAQT